MVFPNATFSERLLSSSRQCMDPGGARFMAEERAQSDVTKMISLAKLEKFQEGAMRIFFWGMIPAVGFKGFLITSGLDMHLREKK